MKNNKIIGYSKQELLEELNDIEPQLNGIINQLYNKSVLQELIDDFEIIVPSCERLGKKVYNYLKEVYMWLVEVKNETNLNILCDELKAAHWNLTQAMEFLEI